MLSAVTVFPAASWIVAVSTRAEPEASEEVEPVSAIWAAVPWVTVKAPRVPVVRPEAVACIVTAPARTPVTVFVATPLEAVEAPVPLTEPAPEAWVKLTEVELSDVTVFPAASWTVAVSTRVAPEVRFAVEPVRATCAAAPGSTVNAPSVPVVRPEAVACMVTVPARAPVTVFVATPELAVAAPVPVTVPVPEALVKLTEVVLSPVTTLPAASLIVAVRSLVEPEVEVRGRAGQHDVRRPRRVDGEGTEGAGGEPARRRLHGDGADERARDRLRGDAGRSRWRRRCP